MRKSPFIHVWRTRDVNTDGVAVGERPAKKRRNKIGDVLGVCVGDTKSCTIIFLLLETFYRYICWVRTQSATRTSWSSLEGSKESHEILSF